MKITKTELMQTIKEELEDMLEYSVEDPHDKLDRMLKDRGVESDQEPGESEEDYWKRKEKTAMRKLFKLGIPQRAAKNLPENKMKITKAKLKEIIKEEISELELEEVFGRAKSDPEARRGLTYRRRTGRGVSSGVMDRVGPQGYDPGPSADPQPSGGMMDRFRASEAGADIGDLPPEAQQELSQQMNKPKIKAIQDPERRRVIMNYLIDMLKDKYGVGTRPGIG
jgi:hypothetical protein